MTRAPDLADFQVALRRFIVDVILTNDQIARRVGLHVVDTQALHLLTLAERELTPSELGARAGLPSSTTTRVIDRLEKAGYVTREPDVADRRKVLLRTRPDKVAAMETEYAEIGRSMSVVYEQFTADEIATVTRFLSAMVASDE